MWLWVKNRYPKWKLGTWKHGLKPAVPEWFNFEPQPGVASHPGPFGGGPFGGVCWGPRRRGQHEHQDAREVRASEHERSFHRLDGQPHLGPRNKTSIWLRPLGKNKHICRSDNTL